MRILYIFTKRDEVNRPDRITLSLIQRSTQDYLAYSAWHLMPHLLSGLGQQKRNKIDDGVICQSTARGQLRRHLLALFLSLSLSLSAISPPCGDLINILLNNYSPSLPPSLCLVTAIPLSLGNHPLSFTLFINLNCN